MVSSGVECRVAFGGAERSGLGRKTYTPPPRSRASFNGVIYIYIYIYIYTHMIYINIYIYREREIERERERPTY